MADTNRIGISYVKEVTIGETPAAALTDIRIKSEDFIYNIENVISEEIRPDRNKTDLVQVGADASGGYTSELSYGEPADDFIGSAMYSTFDADIAFSESSDVSVVGSTSTYSSVGTAFTTTTALDVGRMIYITGFANAVNNGWKRIVTSTAASLVVQSLTTMVDEAAGTLTITMNGQRIKNGVARTSTSIQREASDVAQFFIFRGMVVNTWNLVVASKTIVNSAFTFMGLNSALQQTSWGTGSNVAAPTNEVMNASANVGNIAENGVIDSNLCLQEISFTSNNNLRGIGCVGVLGNVDIGSGTFEVTGNLNAYFKDDSLYDKFTGAIATSLEFSVSDTDGNSYYFTFPKVKFETDSGAQATGENADLMENITWRALLDPTTACTMQLDVFSAP